MTVVNALKSCQMVLQALRRGQCTAREIVDCTGLPRATVYARIKALLHTGAIAHHGMEHYGRRGAAAETFKLTKTGRRSLRIVEGE